MELTGLPKSEVGTHRRRVLILGVVELTGLQETLKFHGHRPVLILGVVELTGLTKMTTDSRKA